MKDFGENIENKWSVESSDLKDTIQDILQPRWFCIEYEDKEFKEDSHQVINSEDLKDIDVAKHNVDRTRAKSDVTKIVNVDPYLGMELCLSKGDEEGLKR